MNTSRGLKTELQGQIGHEAGTMVEVLARQVGSGSGAVRLLIHRGLKKAENGLEPPEIVGPKGFRIRAHVNPETEKRVKVCSEKWGVPLAQAVSKLCLIGLRELYPEIEQKVTN